MTDWNYQFSYYIIHYYSFSIHKLVFTLVQLISHLSKKDQQSPEKFSDQGLTDAWLWLHMNY